MSETTPDYYKLLGVSRNASQQEILQSWRRLQLAHHPDKGGDTEISRKLNEAKRVLLDTLLRTDHDLNRDEKDEDYENDDIIATDAFRLPGGSKFSDTFRNLIESWKSEFTSGIYFKDNTCEVLSKLLNFEEMSDEYTDENYFCPVCEKYFVSDDHHSSVILDPYLDLFTDIDPNFFSSCIEEVLGPLALSFIPIDLPTNTLEWGRPEWQLIPKFLSGFQATQKYFKENDLKKFFKEQDEKRAFRLPPDFTVESIQLENVQNGPEDISYIDFTKFTSGNIDKMYIPQYKKKIPAPWLNGNFCYNCKTSVGFLTRQHCRRCSEVICSSCMILKPILSIGMSSPSKICVVCWKIEYNENGNKWIEKSQLICNSDIQHKEEISQLFLRIARMYHCDFTGSPTNTTPNITCEKYCDVNCKFPNLTFSKFDITLEMITLDTLDSKMIPGDKVSVFIENVDLGDDLEYIPQCTIQSPPKKHENRKTCYICQYNFGYFKNGEHCGKCGQCVCSGIQCSLSKPIFSIGIGTSSPALICKKCYDNECLSNGQMWMEKARMIIYNKIINLYSKVELFLFVAKLYFEEVDEIPYIKACDDFCTLCFKSNQNYEFGLLGALVVKNNEDRFWAQLAAKFAKEKEIMLSGKCLHQINSEDKSYWIRLGKEFTEYDKHLTLFCYRKANLSTTEWLEFAGNLSNDFCSYKYEFIMEASKIQISENSNKSSWLKIVDSFLDSKLYDLVDETISLGKLHFEDLKQLSIFSPENWFKNIETLCYITHYLKFQMKISQKDLDTSLRFLKYVFRILSDIENESGQESLENTFENLEQKIWPDILNTVLTISFMEFNWKPSWKDRRNSYLEKASNNNLDLAILCCKAETIIGENSGLELNLWLDFGMAMYTKCQFRGHLCFLQGSYDLRDVIQIFVKNKNHEAVIQYLIYLDDYSKIWEIGQYLNENNSVSESYIYFAAIYKYINDFENAPYRISKQIELAEDLFNSKPEVLLKIFKSFIILHPELVDHEETEKIHLKVLEQLIEDNSVDSLFLSLAPLHFIQNEDHENILLRQNNAIHEKLKTAIYSRDIQVIGSILANMTGETIGTARQLLQELDPNSTLESFPEDFQCILLLLRGTIKKCSESTDCKEVLNDFLNAMTCCPAFVDETTKAVSKILAADLHFHQKVRISQKTEIEMLLVSLMTWQENENENANTLLPTEICRFKKVLKNSSAVVTMRKCELAIQRRLIKKGKFEEAAFSYIDLIMAVESSSSMLSAFALAAICFLEEIMQSNDGSTVFALRNALIELSGTIIYLCEKTETPFMKVYLYKIILLTLVTANKKLLKVQNIQRSSRSKTVEFLNAKQQRILEISKEAILHSPKMNPFVFNGTSSCFDILFIDYVGITFLKNFYLEKEHQDFYIPCMAKQLYTYNLFEGIWKGWIKIDGLDFERARLLTMESLLLQKGWTLNDVENIMRFPMFPKCPEGWSRYDRKQRLSLIRNGEQTSYVSFDGFRINMKTGEVNLLMTPKSNFKKFVILLGIAKNEPNLFSNEDIEEIFANNIDHAIFTLDPPDVKAKYHPFQEIKYAPKSLSETSFLQSLIRADVLLKQFTTGVEINSEIPFRMKKTEDGLLQRLPLSLKNIMLPLTERKDGISTDDDSAHRFWIEMGEIPMETEDKDDIMTYRFGELKACVKKHLLTRDEQGNLVDDTENDTDDSVEAHFAKELTERYDEIGFYYPELLRIKELTKISLTCSILKNILRSTKNRSKECENPLYTEEISSMLREIREKISYPNQTSENAASVLSRCLRSQNLSERDLEWRQLRDLKEKINSQLIEQDLVIVNSIAGQFSSAFGANTYAVKSLIPRWLTGDNDYKRELIQILEKAKREKERTILQNIIGGIENMGIEIDDDDEAKEKFFGSNGECVWVPAAFVNCLNKSGNTRGVYGGVALLPSTKRKPVASSIFSSSYSVKNICPKLSSTNNRVHGVRKSNTTPVNKTDNRKHNIPRDNYKSSSNNYGGRGGNGGRGGGGAGNGGGNDDGNKPKGGKPRRIWEKENIRERRDANVPKTTYEAKLGPSGRPMRHFDKSSSRKEAQDKAHLRGGKNKPEHNSPHKQGQPSHYHALGRDGERIEDGVHYTYGKGDVRAGRNKK